MTRKLALLLEDEALIALNIESTLESVGYEVVSFATCAEALNWLHLNSPSVAILDLHLRDGPSNAVSLLLTERRIPFVVHSGTSGSAASAPDFSAGTWLNKPSSGHDMLASISNALGATVPRMHEL
ncbi:MAG: response regulator [Devosia sp.]